MSSRKAEMVLELIDRTTRPLQRMMGLLGRFGSAAELSNKIAARAAAAAERASRGYERAINGLKTAQSGLDRVIERANAKIKKQSELMKNGGGLMGKGMQGIGAAAITAGAVASAYSATALAAAGAIIGPAAQFEKFAIQLETLEGSSAKGKAAMAWIEGFATKTPLELNQVVQSFAQMRSFGLDPTNGSMQAMMDTASAMGGGYEMLQSMTLALGKAQTKGKLQGEEIMMLMERGIPVYDLLGQKMGKTSAEIAGMATAGKLGRAEIALLIGAMGEKNFGASDKISKSWDGIVSNIMDWSTKFRRMVADAGVFDFLKSRLQGVLNTLQKMSDSGELQVWANLVAKHILKVLTGMWNLGKWVVSTWKSLSPWVQSAARALGGYQNLLLAIMAIPFRRSILGLALALGQLAAGAVMTGWGLTGMGFAPASVAAARFGSIVLSVINPMNLVRGAALAMRVALLATGIGAIAFGIGAAGMWIYNNWSGLGVFFSEIGSAFMQALGPFAPVVTALGTAFGGLVDWVSALLGPVDASGATWKRWGQAVGRVIGGAVRWVAKFVTWVGNLFSGMPVIDWAALIPSFSWSTVFTALNWLSYLLPIRWLEFIPGFSWSKVLSKITSWGEWLVSLDWSGFIAKFPWDSVLTALNWLSYLMPIRWLEFIPGFSWNSVLKLVDWASMINLDGLQRAWSGLKDWISDKANGLWDALPKIEWGGPAQGGGSARSGGLRSIAKLDGARASGGPVWRGGSFMVGERGPELFMPKSNGWIVPNHAVANTNALPPAQRGISIGRPPSDYAAGSGSGGTVSVNAPFNLTVNGNADNATLAKLQDMIAARDRELIRKIERAARDKVRLGHGGH